MPNVPTPIHTAYEANHNAALPLLVCARRKGALWARGEPPPFLPLLPSRRAVGAVRPVSL
jgi:hypothetical protein